MNISSAIAEILKREGISFLLNSSPTRNWLSRCSGKSNRPRSGWSRRCPRRSFPPGWRIC